MKPESSFIITLRRFGISVEQLSLIREAIGIFLKVFCLILSLFFRFLNLTVYGASGKIDGVVKFSPNPQSNDLYSFTTFVNELNVR